MNEIDNNNKNNNIKNESLKQNESEEEYKPDGDRQSEQTQATLDKNYILSRIRTQPIFEMAPRFLNEENINMRHVLPTKKFYFIDDIEQELYKIP